jgi:hypothetical protein
MTTRLEGALKREIDVDGRPYTLTINPQGLTLVPKGRRKGVQLEWDALVSGEAALATALNASVMDGAHRHAPPSGDNGAAPRAPDADGSHERLHVRTARR